MAHLASASYGVVPKYRTGTARYLFNLCVIFLLYVAPLNKLYWDVGFRIRTIYIVTPVALFLFAVLFFARPYIRKFTLLPLVLYSLILICAFVSIFFAIDKVQWVKGFLDLVIGIAIVMVVVYSITTRAKLQTVVSHWLLIGLFMSIYGVAQLIAKLYFNIELDQVVIEPISLGLRRSGLDSYSRFYRVTSFIEDSSNYAIYLCGVWPLFAVKALRAWRQGRWGRSIVLVSGFGLTFGNFILTLSRSGYLGFLVVLPIIVWYFQKDVFRLTQQTIKFSGRMFFLTALAFFCILSLSIIYRQPISEIFTLRTSSSEGTRLHFELLRISLEVSLLNPLGIGLNNFPIYYSTYYRPDQPPVWSTFNSFTLLSSEIGIIGLFAYLTLFLFIISRLHARVKREVQSNLRDIYFGIEAGLIAILVASFSYTSFQNGYFNAFLGIALAAALFPAQLATIQREDT